MWRGRSSYSIQLRPEVNTGENSDRTPEGQWGFIDSYNYKIMELIDPSRKQE
jgi:hypothetical protein